MAGTSTDLAARIGRLCRTVTVAVLAGVFRKHSMSEIDSDLKARPIRQQVLIIGSILGLLFGLCLVAAQFGWVGMLIFWLAVIVLVK